MTRLHTVSMVSAMALVTGLTALTVTPAEARNRPLYSGGSTLAAKMYRSLFNCYNNKVLANGTQTYPSALPTECSGTNTTTVPFTSPYPGAANIDILYAPVGSGAGLAAFQAANPAIPTAAPTALGTPAASNSVAYTTTAYAAYPYPALDFVGSDAALTTAQIANVTPANGDFAIQIPAFATPIALPFNPGAGFTYPTSHVIPAGGSSNLRFTPPTICGIFTGAITDWSDSHLTADNGGVKLVSTPTPITVIVRADGSGTTAIFSNWLVQTCTAAGVGHAYPVASSFSAGTAPSWPAGVTKVSGSGGIANAINATPYSIGYVSPDYVQPVVASGPATANIRDPLNVAEAPTAKGAAKLLALVKAPAATAGAYAWGQPLNNTLENASNLAAASYPGGAYPIVGFTFLDFYGCYATTGANNVTAGSDVKGFLLNYFLSSSANAIAEVDALLNDNGFATTDGISSFKIHEQGLANQIVQATGTTCPDGATGIEG